MGTILAERDLQGYPETTVRIEMTADGKCEVIVKDSCGDFMLHSDIVAGVTNRERAKDCYFHPFAFGYVRTEA